MNVLYITNNYPTNGNSIFGIFVKEQIESVEPLGITADVVFVNGRERGKLEYGRAWSRLRRKIRANDHDLVHCHHAFSAALLLLAGVPRRQPLVVSYQNDPEREGGLLLYGIIRRAFNRIILKNCSKCFDEAKCTYLPNGVDMKRFRPIERGTARDELSLLRDKKYVLFMDSYKRRRQKRIDRYEKVIQILRSEYGMKEVEPIVLTETKRELIPLYMNAANLHLITSDFEGSPNSVKECMACNVPVVSTNVGNVQDLIGDVDGCAVVDSFDCHVIAKHVVEVLRGERVAGREAIVRKGLDRETVALRLKQLYEELLQ